jgi:spermidine synthase
MIELNEDQRLEVNGHEPIVFDPVTRQKYVLVRAEIYERLKSLLADDTMYTSADRVWIEHKSRYRTLAIGREISERISRPRTNVR